MGQFLLSPPALNYLPVLLMHLVGLGYHLLRGPRSRQSWLFCGWLGGMTVMVASQCAAWSLYGAAWVTYLEWCGGIVGVNLAIIALMQFAYAFPNPRYPREARLALILSLLITGGLFLMMGSEIVAIQTRQIYATTLGDAEAALAPRAVWITYDFTRFSAGYTSQHHAIALTSPRLFDIWQVVSNLWILIIWLRKAVRGSTPATAGPHTRRLWDALRHPQGREARLARSWMLLMLLAPLPIVASNLENTKLAPPGTFATTHLLVFFAILLTYINGSPEPTTVRAKLGGVSLVTLLAILGIGSRVTMGLQAEAYAQMRAADLAVIATHIEEMSETTLLTEAFAATLPTEVVYIATRPTAKLLTSDYDLVAARPDGPDAATLAAHDRVLQAGLTRGLAPARYALRHEHPWLTPRDVRALEGALGNGDANASAYPRALRIPEDAIGYRGSASEPRCRVVRYFFVLDGTRYEVGFDYLTYRHYLHRAGRGLAMLMVGATLAIVGCFPLFFRGSIIAPLMRLIDGVNRVNDGELDVDIPIWMHDEIGDLTDAFNRMVGSLRDSEARLQTLNLTLEQRVLDRTRDLATLYRIASLVSKAVPLDSLLRATLAELVPALESAAGGMIFLENGSGVPPALTATYGTPDGWDLRTSPLWHRVCDADEAMAVHDLQAVGTDDSSTSLPFTTVACAPIRGKTARLGTVAIFGHTPGHFAVEELTLLSSVSEQLRIAIENARLREQAATVIVLEERQRLARDLHDSVTQLIYSQTLFAKGAVRYIEEGQLDRVAHCVNRLNEAAHRALREMRLMIYRLRPADLDELGLVGALRRRLELVEQRAGIHVALVAAPSIDSARAGGAHRSLPPQHEAALFQIAEEALTNALKHADATEIHVELRHEKQELLMCVTDDGCGFDVSRTSYGLGLQSLHERADNLGGRLTIASAPGVGTRIIARLPLTHTSEA